MKITFDVVSRELSFDASDAQPWGGDLSAAINRYGQRLDIRGLTMGITVTSNGVTILDKSWPPAGVKYTNTDQDVILTERLVWNSDEAIVIDVWFDLAGERHEATYNLTAPRPPQPYPSWTWGGTAWEPPVPYPNDGQEYVWDEANQEWDLA